MTTMTKTNHEIRIYVANLAEYVAGRLVGEWIELPMDSDELQEVLNRISYNGRDELAIHDYEAPFNISEYSSIHETNRLAQEIEDADVDPEIFEALMSALGDVETAVQVATDNDYRVYYDCNDMSDVAYEIVEEHGYLHNVPDFVSRYFDYEAFGRDLAIEGTFESFSNGYIEIYQ